MIMKEVQQSMQIMFKQMHQQNCWDNDSDIDESHHIEVMEDIMVSECYNLSDLHQPPTKKTKTQHFAPITTASTFCPNHYSGPWNAFRQKNYT